MIRHRNIPLELAPALCPGGLWVRIYSVAGELLTDHAIADGALDDDGTLDVVGDGDWRYLVAYDGDTGALVYVAVADEDGGR